MANIEEDTLVMQAIVELHKQGYGRLKLFCYIKEGIGEWRHWLFASDCFPESISQLPKPNLHGSIPHWLEPTLAGNTPAEAAEDFIKLHPDIAAAAVGSDPIYVPWFASIVNQCANESFEMESRFKARIGGRLIQTPYSRTL